MRNPRVSVVMSVCNGRAYLAEAVRSILSQSFGDFEFIATDDGSTDGSAECLQEFARHDARLRVVRQANAGLTVSLNRMMADARGAYIARMDADDISLPDRFAAQVDYLDRHPRCAVVGTGYVVVDAEGRPAGGTQPLDRPRRLRAWILGASGNPLCHGSTMIRREALRGLDPVYRWRYSQDFDLWVRLLVNWDVGVVESVLYRYREHGASIGSKRHLVPLRLQQRRKIIELMQRGQVFDQEICRREIDAIFAQVPPEAPASAGSGRLLQGYFYRGDFAALAAECRRLHAAGQRSRRLSGWQALSCLPVAWGHLAYDLAVRVLNLAAPVQRRLLVGEVTR